MEIKCLKSLQNIQNCSSDMLTISLRQCLSGRYIGLFHLKMQFLFYFSPCYFSLKKKLVPFQHACARSEMCTVYMYKYYIQGRTKVSLFQNNFALRVIWSVHETVLLLHKYDVVVTPHFSVESKVNLRGCVGSSSSPHTLRWSV